MDWPAEVVMRIPEIYHENAESKRRSSGADATRRITDSLIQLEQIAENPEEIVGALAPAARKRTVEKLRTLEGQAGLSSKQEAPRPGPRSPVPHPCVNEVRLLTHEAQHCPLDSHAARSPGGRLPSAAVHVHPFFSDFVFVRPAGSFW
jgi:hypothetical protein